MRHKTLAGNECAGRRREPKDLKNSQDRGRDETTEVGRRAGSNAVEIQLCTKRSEKWLKWKGQEGVATMQRRD